MSRIFEMLHGGHGGNRPHLAAHPRGARSRQLVGVARASAFSTQADSAPASLAPMNPRESTQPASPSAWRQFANLDDHAVAAYKRLLLQMDRKLDLSEPRCVCLTSADTDEDKTATAINLAFVAAQQGERRVIVVDANLARPQIARRLGIEPQRGLSELLSEGLFPSEVIEPVPLGGFDLIGAGQIDRRDTELLSSRRMDVLLSDLKQSYDLIIIDAPHVSDQSAATILTRDFDAIYLVVKTFETRRQVVHTALGQLQSAGVKVRGCILTHEGTLPNDLSDLNDLDVIDPPVPSIESLSSVAGAPTIQEIATCDWPALPVQSCDTLETSNYDTTTVSNDWSGVAFASERDSDFPMQARLNPETKLQTHAKHEPCLDTLAKLETIRPFDSIERIADDAPADPRLCDDDEAKLISALEASVDNILKHPQPMPDPTTPSLTARLNEHSSRSSLRRLRIHQSDPLSPASEQPEPNLAEPIGTSREIRTGAVITVVADAASVGSDAGSIRHEATLVDAPVLTDEPWAANVLAVCGGLLTLAGILYVLVDVVFWF